MIRLGNQFIENRWLDPDNPYRGDPSDALRNHGHLRTRKQDRALAEYIAVSAILHCFDGWSFLGRALNAEMTGNRGTAIHLGYYAELRAAMALLASQGIGVFRNKHCVVGASGYCTPVPRREGTHSFAWKALNCWTDDKAADVLFKIILVFDRSLHEWMTRFHKIDSGVGLYATDLVKGWGLDIQPYTADRMVRNSASYRPNTLASSGASEITEVVRPAMKIWKLCEPSSGVFSGLDRVLLRHSLETVYQNKYPYRKSAREAKNQYGTQVRQVLDELAPLGAKRLEEKIGVLTEFLDPLKGLNRNVLSDARQQLKPDMSRIKPILYRAMLLLRLATGCAKELLATNGSDVRERFKFWWSCPSVNRRLWKNGSPPEEFSDLWRDAGDAIENLEDWLQAGASEKSGYEFWRKHAAQAAVLTTTERICLWGLGL